MAAAGSIGPAVPGAADASAAAGNSWPAIVHCDHMLVAVNKRACVPSVPDASGDLSVFDQAKAAVAQLYNKPGDVWLANVHRLDRPVSGALLFARSSKGARRLSAAFQAREVAKIYWGLCLGTTLGAGGGASSGTVSQWLRKDSATNTTSVVPPNTRGASEVRCLVHSMFRSMLGLFSA